MATGVTQQHPAAYKHMLNMQQGFWSSRTTLCAQSQAAQMLPGQLSHACLQATTYSYTTQESGHDIMCWNKQLGAAWFAGSGVSRELQKQLLHVEDAASHHRYSNH